VKSFAQFLLLLWKGGGQGIVVMFCAVGLLAVGPYVAQQLCYSPREPIGRIEIIAQQAEITAREITARQVEQIYLGAHPQDEKYVPYWQRQFQALDKLAGSMDRLAVSMDGQAAAARALAAEWEDHLHRRPPRRTGSATSTPTTPLPEDLSLIERVIRWARG
jgi:hypothetical protein